MVFFQLFQGVGQCDQTFVVHRAFHAGLQHDVQRQRCHALAALGGHPLPRPAHQHLAHRQGRGRKEVAVAAEAHLTGQFQVGLVDQGGGLHGLRAVPDAGAFAPRQALQVGVEQLDQQADIALIDGGRRLAHVGDCGSSPVHGPGRRAGRGGQPAVLGYPVDRLRGPDATWMARLELDPADERLLDRALAMVPARRAAFLQRACRGDEARLRRLLDLLAHAGRHDGFLDAIPPPSGRGQEAAARMAAGQRLGPWQLKRPLGAGGMGEVWLAERVEGGFDQQVAIKVLATGVADDGRFRRERAILAGLEHPGIARLYDGGVAPEGLAYMAMEYVDGEDLLAWCRRTRADLRDRLDLFLQVCEAVAYAHAQLVVHRDLKPANILVDGDGRIKLLDFGIAHLLEDPVLGDASATLHLSAAYAAPEQLTGGRISVATDVHALGVVLHELLTGALPWPVTGLPLGAAVRRLLESTPPMPSQASRPGYGVPPRLLRGDLDAIVGKALRPEPAHRYADARALAADLRRCLAHRPVHARQGAGLYVLRRFLRRNRWPVAASAMVLAALLAGTLAVAWQARLARDQAARATATKDFLVRVFRASDPHVASDTPGGQITARELLERGAARISSDFAGQPALETELLGLTASLFRALGEHDRYRAFQHRHMALARARLGERHPMVIEGRLLEADDAVLMLDYAGAERILGEIDPVIRQAGLDRSALRARWWMRLGSALEADPARIGERIAALERAVELFERTEPGDRELGIALANLGAAHWERGGPGDDRRAADHLAQAAAVLEQALDRYDGELLVSYANLGHARAALGDHEGADAASLRAIDLALRTHGEDSAKYWHALATRASNLHGRGDREQALAGVARILALLPAEPSLQDEDNVALVRTMIGGLLVHDGQPAAAVEHLERALLGHQRAHRGHRLGYLQRMLGEAYEATGRDAEAAEAFALSLAEVVAWEGADSAGALMARERAARLLLRRAGLDEAEREFEAILGAPVPGAGLAHALALAGQARVALARGDGRRALALSGQALARMDALAPPSDPRTLPMLWLLHAEALAATGAGEQAREHAGRALAACRRFQHPLSPERAAAEDLLARLARAD